MAVPRGSQRRRRPALGEASSPGKSGTLPVPLSAAAHAPTKNQAARSGAERAEREAVQMRSCTPTPSAPSATGRQHRSRRRLKRARRAAQIGAGTGTPTPVRAEGNCTGARLAPFSLPPGAAHSLFGATKKRMGGASPVGTAPCGSRIPRAADCRPYGVSGRKPPLWGRGEKKRRPAFRPAASRSAVTPKIPSGSGPPPPPR